MNHELPLFQSVPIANLNNVVKYKSTLKRNQMNIFQASVPGETLFHKVFSVKKLLPSLIESISVAEHCRPHSSLYAQFTGHYSAQISLILLLHKWIANCSGSERHSTRGLLPLFGTDFLTDATLSSEMARRLNTSARAAFRTVISSSCC